MDELDKLMQSAAPAESSSGDALDKLIQEAETSTPAPAIQGPSLGEMQAAVDADKAAKAAAAQQKLDNDEFQQLTSFGTLQVPGARAPKNLEEARLYAKGDLKKYQDFVATADVVAKSEAQKAEEDLINTPGPEQDRAIASKLMQSVVNWPLEKLGADPSWIKPLVKPVTDFIASNTIPIEGAVTQDPYEDKASLAQKMDPLRPSNYVDAILPTKQKRALLIHTIQVGSLNFLDRIAGAAVDLVSPAPVRLGAGFTKALDEALGPRPDQPASEQELRRQYVAMNTAENVMKALSGDMTVGTALRDRIREELKTSAAVYPVTAFFGQMVGGGALGVAENLVYKAATGAFMSAKANIIGASIEGAVSGIGMTDPGSPGQAYVDNLAIGAALGAALAGAVEGVGAYKRAMEKRLAPELRAIVLPDGARELANQVEAGGTAKFFPEEPTTKMEVGEPTLKMDLEAPATQKLDLGDTGQMGMPKADGTKAEGFRTPKITKPSFDKPAAPKVEAAFVVGDDNGVFVKLTGDVEETIQIRDQGDVDKALAAMKGRKVDAMFSDRVLEMMNAMDLDSAKLITSLMGETVDAPKYPTYSGYFTVVKGADGKLRAELGSKPDAAAASLSSANIRLVKDATGVPGLASVVDGIATPLPFDMGAKPTGGIPTLGKAAKVEKFVDITPDVVTALRKLRGVELMDKLSKLFDEGEQVQTRAAQPEITPEVSRALSKEPMKLRSVVVDKKNQFLISDAMIRKWYGVNDETARTIFNRATKRSRGEPGAPAKNLFLQRGEMGGERGLVATSLNPDEAAQRIHAEAMKIIADEAAEGIAFKRATDGLPDPVMIVPQAPEIAGFERLSKAQKYFAVTEQSVLPVKDLAAEFGATPAQVVEAAKTLGIPLEFQSSAIAAKDMTTAVRQIMNYLSNGAVPKAGDAVELNSFVIPPFVNPAELWMKDMSLGSKLDFAQAIDPNNVSAWEKQSAAWMAKNLERAKSDSFFRNTLNRAANAVMGVSPRAPKLLADLHNSKLGISAMAERRGEILNWMTSLFGKDATLREVAGQYLSTPPGPMRDKFFNLLVESKAGSKLGQIMSDIRAEMDWKSAEIRKRTGIDVMATVDDEAGRAYSVRLFAKYAMPDGEWAKVLMRDEKKMSSIVKAAAKDLGISEAEAYNVVVEIAQPDIHQMDPLGGSQGSYRQSLKKRKNLPEWYKEALGEIKDGPLMVAHTLSRQDAILEATELWARVSKDTRIASKVPEPPEMVNGTPVPWQKLPENRARYGDAAGMYLHPAAFEVLENINPATAAVDNVFKDIITWQKMALVPLAGVRAVTMGTFGNLTFAAMGGIMRPGNLREFWADMITASEAMWAYAESPSHLKQTAGPVFDAYRHSALRPSLGSGEVHRATRIWSDAVKKAGQPEKFRLAHAGTVFFDALKTGAANAAETFDFVTDRWWKLGSYIHLSKRAMSDPMRWMGVDPSTVSKAELKELAGRWAAQECRKSFPYPDDVGKAVDAARRNLAGVVAFFATYAAEEVRIVSQVPSRAMGDPGYAANLAAWGTAIGAAGLGLTALRQMEGITDEEVAAAKRAQGANRSAGLIALPIRDSVTKRPILLDVSSYVPGLRYFFGVNGDKSLIQNAKQVAANVLVAPVSGGAAERPVRNALTPLLGEDVFGFPLDKKANPDDDGYIQFMRFAAESGAVPRFATALMKNLQDTRKTYPQTPMSSETFWMRELLGLQVPRSVGEEEARMRLRMELQGLKKDRMRDEAGGMDFINQFVEKNPQTLRETRAKNNDRRIKETQEKMKVLEAGERAAKKRSK